MQILVETLCRRLIKEAIDKSVLESFSHKLSTKSSKTTATKVRYYSFTKFQSPMIKLESSNMEAIENFSLFSTLQANFPVS